MKFEIESWKELAIASSQYIIDDSVLSEHADNEQVSLVLVRHLMQRAYITGVEDALEIARDYSGSTNVEHRSEKP